VAISKVPSVRSDKVSLGSHVDDPRGADANYNVRLVIAGPEDCLGWLLEKFSNH
jgi:hypothetical protein